MIYQALEFAGIWFLATVPIGIFVGKFIKAGRGPALFLEEEE